MQKVATIAGSDASGGAGLEADLKTFEEYGLFGMAAVTVIATMNPDDNWSHSVFRNRHIHCSPTEFNIT